MTRDQFIRRMAENGDFYISHTERYFKVFLATLAEVLAEGEKVTLKGLGTFNTCQTKDKQLHIGDRDYFSPAHMRVTFKPGEILTRGVNEKRAHDNQE